MLGKVMKYDFKSINRPLFILYAITIVTSLINIITNNYGSNEVLLALFLLSTDVALIFLFLSFFFSIVVCYWNFRETMFKDEAYLTHTLPVKRQTIYDAKVIVSLITILISLTVSGLAFVFVFSHLSIVEFIEKTYIQEKGDFRTLYFCILSVLKVFMCFLCLIDGIIIGYRFNKRKDLKSFLFTCILITIIQFVILTFDNVFNENLSRILDILLCVFVNIILYIVGRTIIKKGVNLE